MSDIPVEREPKDHSHLEMGLSYLVARPKSSGKIQREECVCPGVVQHCVPVWPKMPSLKGVLKLQEHSTVSINGDTLVRLANYLRDQVLRNPWPF